MRPGVRGYIHDGTCLIWGVTMLRGIEGMMSDWLD